MQAVSPFTSHFKGTHKQISKCLNSNYQTLFFLRICSINLTPGTRDVNETLHSILNVYQNELENLYTETGDIIAFGSVLPLPLMLIRSVHFNREGVNQPS